MTMNMCGRVWGRSSLLLISSLVNLNFDREKSLKQSKDCKWSLSKSRLRIQFLIFFFKKKMQLGKKCINTNLLKVRNTI